MDQEDHLYREATALWRAVFGDAPPPAADGATLLGIIVTRGPDPAAYQRLNSPFLRPTTIAEPGRPRPVGLG